MLYSFIWFTTDRTDSKWTNIAISKHFYKTRGVFSFNQWNYFQRGCIDKRRSSDCSIQTRLYIFRSFRFQKAQMLDFKMVLKDWSYWTRQWIYVQSFIFIARQLIHMICVENMKNIWNVKIRLYIIRTGTTFRIGRSYDNMAQCWNKNLEKLKYSVLTIINSGSVWYFFLCNV